MVISFGVKSVPTNHGAVRLIQCGKCNNSSIFDLISEKAKASLYFIPLFTMGETWALRCRNCGIQLVLSGAAEIANAIDLNRAIKSDDRGEITTAELNELAEKYPLPSVDHWINSNTNVHCPSCNAEVPATFQQCWKCGGRV